MPEYCRAVVWVRFLSGALKNGDVNLKKTDLLRISRVDLEAFTEKITGGKMIVNTGAQPSTEDETTYLMRKRDFEGMLRGIKMQFQAAFKHKRIEFDFKYLEDTIKIHFKDPRNDQVIDAVIHYQKGVVDESVTGE